MANWNGLLKRLCLVAGLFMVTVPNSGCNLLYWAAKDAFILANFWGTTPLIPVTPYFSQQIEDTYWEEERYGKVPILDPVEGENAPLFCLDPPSADEVVRALPDQTSGGVAFLAETSRNNVRMIVEPIVDRLDECRFYPMAGPADCTTVTTSAPSSTKKPSGQTGLSPSPSPNRSKKSSTSTRIT